MRPSLIEKQKIRNDTEASFWFPTVKTIIPFFFFYFRIVEISEIVRSITYIDGKKNVLKRPDVCLCRLVSMWGCKLNTSWETHIRYISGEPTKILNNCNVRGNYYCSVVVCDRPGSDRKNEYKVFCWRITQHSIKTTYYTTPLDLIKSSLLTPSR